MVPGTFWVRIDVLGIVERSNEVLSQPEVTTAPGSADPGERGDFTARAFRTRGPQAGSRYSPARRSLTLAQWPWPSGRLRCLNQRHSL